MRSWLTDERLRVYPLLVLGMLVFGFVALLTASYGIGKGGDFVSFYSAGEIVGSGRAASLYDWSTQKAVQSATAPGSLTGMLPFAYPPFVALAYVPLSKLDYRVAYALHTVGMALIVYLAVVLLLPVFRRIGSQPLAATVALLAFYPLSRGVLGQTTAVSVLLISVAWRLSSRRARHLGGSSRRLAPLQAPARSARHRSRGSAPSTQDADRVCGCRRSSPLRRSGCERLGLVSGMVEPSRGVPAGDTTG